MYGIYPPTCPPRFTIYEGTLTNADGWVPASSPAISSFSVQTGQLIINTSDVSLAGTSINIVIEGSNGEETRVSLTSAYQLIFYVPNPTDPCLETQILPPPIPFEDVNVIWGTTL